MIIPCSGKRGCGERQEDGLQFALLVQLSVDLLKNSYLEEIRDVLGISLHKIYSQLWLYNNHPDLKQKVIDGKMSCEAGRLTARLTWIEQKNQLVGMIKSLFSKVQSTRRVNQLALLDLDSITIPKVSEYDSLLQALTNFCTKIPNGWEQEAIVEAIKALESLGAL